MDGDSRASSLRLGVGHLQAQLWGLLGLLERGPHLHGPVPRADATPAPRCAGRVVVRRPGPEGSVVPAPWKEKSGPSEARWPPEPAAAGPTRALPTVL